MTQRLGILGGGQLGRMMALAANPLGLEVTVLDPNTEAPARAAAKHLQASYNDRDALGELRRSDWITFEFENIPESAVQECARGTRFNPPVNALHIAQDRWTEKSLFNQLGIETPSFRQVDSQKDAEKAFDELGPLVLKTRRLGYDGKGQAVVQRRSELKEAYASLKGASAIAEEWITYQRELSVLICRSRDGDIEIYPITENTHKKGVLRKSVAPAPNLSEALSVKAESAARLLVDHFSYVGVLALELFQVKDRLLANEFAPRVHNSGHWTIEGAVTSQFENHVRAVCGLPLGSAQLRSPSVMTNLLDSIPPKEKVLALEDTHLHDYAKEARVGRKVGHVTSVGKTLDEALRRAAALEAIVKAAESGRCGIKQGELSVPP